MPTQRDKPTCVNPAVGRLLDDALTNSLADSDIQIFLQDHVPNCAACRDAMNEQGVALAMLEFAFDHDMTVEQVAESFIDLSSAMKAEAVGRGISFEQAISERIREIAKRVSVS